MPTSITGPWRSEAPRVLAWGILKHLLGWRNSPKPDPSFAEASEGCPAIRRWQKPLTKAVHPRAPARGIRAKVSNRFFLAFWNFRSKTACSFQPRGAGYTLIELTVVIFLIGIMLALTMPRIQGTFLSDDLKTATRRMIGTVKTLREKAVKERKGYKLYLDMESNRFWVEWDTMTDEERSEARQNASSFPGDVRILDVSRPGMGSKSVGDAAIHFTKKGYMEQAVIHLGVRNDRVSTIVLSPFLGAVKTYDEYVELEDT